MKTLLLLLCLALVATLNALAADTKKKSEAHPPSVGYTDTPMLPGGKWHVHDPNRPQPTVVAPGTFSTPTTPGKAPSDAIVLFYGKDLSKWSTDAAYPEPWIIQDRIIYRNPMSVVRILKVV